MDNRTHLIERAAARISPFAAPAAPLAGDRAGVDKIVRPDLPPREGPSNPAIADEIADPPRHISDDALTHAGMLVWDASNRHIAEEFRVIQGRILRQSFAVNGAGAPAMGNLLMITSALQGEGKSFCALNLAGEIARQGDRDVLLVDADPNPQGLAQRMGVRGPGLLDLARRSGLIAERIAVPTAVAHLDFLPFGNNESGSAELFASRRMAEAIETLARSRPDRLVIFDAPPCLGSSTPHTLAPIVGQIALVVAAGRTQEGDIEAALDLLHANQNVSVLLNKVPSWFAHSFGSYAYGSTAAN